MCEDEDFVRYHFGEMSPEERDAFRGRLDSDPELAARFARFRLCVEDCDANDAPDGLADRTEQSLRSLTSSTGVDIAGRSAQCRLVDWTAGSLAVLLVALALIPATLMSRESARRAACEKNLEAIGQALFAYADDRRGLFPSIGPRNFAGFYAVSLADGQYLSRDEISNLLVCPSSALAKRVADGEIAVIVPTREELRLAPAIVVRPLSRVMGGSYAYRLGYVDDDVYQPVRYTGNCRAAILADAPTSAATSARNHGGCAQNMLFQDGSVRFVTGCWSIDRNDHFFLNSLGEIGAGQTRHDTVLAPSWASPGPVQQLFDVRPVR